LKNLLPIRSQSFNRDDTLSKSQIGHRD